MNQNNLSFESENFQIHYLTFNLQFDDLERIKKIADYLSKTFDCKSVLIDCKNPKQVNSKLFWKSVYLFL